MTAHTPQLPYFKALRMAAAPLTKPQARTALRYIRLAQRREPCNPGYSILIANLYDKHPGLATEDI